MNLQPLSGSSCMGMVLTINSISLHTPAWQVQDLMKLWEEAAFRGSDRQVPGLEGDIPYPRRRAAKTYSLPMIVIGGVDHTGSPYGSDPNPPYGGLFLNVKYLTTNVVAPAGGDGTRSASLTMPDGTTRTARITVLDLTLGDHAGAGLYATLDISIPAGRFT